MRTGGTAVQPALSGAKGRYGGKFAGEIIARPFKGAVQYA